MSVHPPAVASGPGETTLPEGVLGFERSPKGHGDTISSNAEALPFVDRSDAGHRLAERLTDLRSVAPVVLGLPRGGVPVAFEVARALHAPLDLLLVRKVRVAARPELAIGAVGEGGVRVSNHALVASLGLDQAEVEAAAQQAERELAEQARRLRGARVPVLIKGRTVLIVDDGIATGATARAAVEVADERGATRVVLAVPVGPLDARASWSRDPRDLVILATPSPFNAVGSWYRDFTPTSTRQVARLLGELTQTDP